ncbi:hypothetical protein [Streptomyces sp. NPDC059455]
MSGIPRKSPIAGTPTAPPATADPDPEVHRVLTEKVFPHQA